MIVINNQVVLYRHYLPVFLLQLQLHAFILKMDKVCKTCIANVIACFCVNNV